LAGDPQFADFNLEGVDAAIAPVKAGCAWV